MDECPICYEPFSSGDADSDGVCVDIGSGRDADEQDRIRSAIDASSASSDNVGAPLSAVAERVCVRPCRHAFCRECLAAHCEYAIESNAIPIGCPHRSARDQKLCAEHLHRSVVRDLLLAGTDPSDADGGQFDVENQTSKSADTVGTVSLQSSTQRSSSSSTPLGTEQQERRRKLWQRFDRFHRLSQDSDLTACTRCHALNSKSSDRFDRLQDVDQTSHLQLFCKSCRHQYCVEHGDAHPYVTCLQYVEHRQSARARCKSERVIRKFTKPCSHCKVPIHKEAGCDHVVCPSCRQDFCFKCGTHVHLTGTSLRTCSKCRRSYIDHRYMWTYRLSLLCGSLLLLPCDFMYFLGATVLCILTLGFFCFYGCGIERVVVSPTDNDNNNNNDNDRNNNCTHSSLNKSTNVPNKQQRRTAYRLRPVKGARRTLSVVCRPCIRMADECAIPCCLTDLDVPRTETMELSDDDDDDSCNQPKRKEPVGSDAV